MAISRVFTISHIHGETDENKVRAIAISAAARAGRAFDLAMAVEPDVTAILVDDFGSKMEIKLPSWAEVAEFVAASKVETTFG